MGLLHQAAKAIPAGRSFVRRLIDLSMRRPEMHHVLRLSAEAKADLWWWSLFLEHWNGSGFSASIPARPTFWVQSDASGSWGCAAVTGSRWFNAPCSSAWRPERIALKELLPVVAAWESGVHVSGRALSCFWNQIIPRSLRQSTWGHPAMPP